MPIVVMERQEPEPVSDEKIEMMKQATEVCLDINGVSRTLTYLSSDRKRFVCVFEAPDVESVRRALESAKMDYEKIWPATTF